MIQVAGELTISVHGAQALLHDATRWKLQHIGRHTLSGTRPPRHGQV